MLTGKRLHTTGTILQPVMAAQLIHRHHYYVDSIYGNDGNSGTQRSKPWQTIGRVNAAAAEELVPTALVRLQRGGTWRVTNLDPPSSGVDGNHVRFGAYGSGDKPIISGAFLVTGWASTVGAEYKASVVYAVHVYADNTQLTLGAAAGALNEGEFFFDGVADELHVRLVAGDDPSGFTMEAAAINYGIQVNVSYIDLKDIVVDKVVILGVFLASAASNLTDIILNGLDVTRTGHDCIRVGSTGGAAVNPQNVTVQDCSVNLWDRAGGDDSYGVRQALGDGSGGNNLQVLRNTIGGWIAFGADTNLSRNGIRVDGGAGITIHANEITGVDHGIQLVTVPTGWDIAYNYIHDTGDDGMYFYNLNDANGMVYNNVIVNVSDQAFDLYSTGVGNFGTFAFNTVYNPLSQCIGLRGNDGMTAIFKNNLLAIANDGVGTRRHIQVIDTATTIDVEDFVFDNNLYYDYDDPPVDANFALYSSGANETWAQWQAHGLDANGVTDDPDLVNVGGTDPEDYDILAISPAIGAGVAVVGITDDYDGVARGDPPDIGAYQNVP